MGKVKFRVVIVGGSVSGLALAHMLSRFGIDHVLLEAHEDVAPDLGASIALMPGSQRILDQLGLYDAVVASADVQPTKFGIRGNDGKLICSSDTWIRELEMRHGYPMRWMHRQALLQTLYEELPDKKKIQLGQRVTGIEVVGHGVEVLTTSGQIFTGDIVIGADGTYSKVWEEMLRITSETLPDYFTKTDRNPPQPDYACLFGISKHPSVQYQKFISCEKRAYLLAPGPNGHKYWFLFVPVQAVGSADERHFTKEDVARVAKRYRDDLINETATFRDLYETSFTSGMTHVRDHCSSKWHYRRMAVIGDAAHKQNPISGYGATGAVEDATALVNELLKALGPFPHTFTEQQIGGVFAAVEATRLMRARETSRSARSTQRYLGREAPASPLFRMFLRHGGLTTLMEQTSKANAQCLKLNALPVPVRERAMPYDDELPAKPLPQSRIIRGTTLGLLGLIWWMSLRCMRLSTLDMRRFAGGWLKVVYTGLPVDDLLSKIVAVFSYPMVGPDLASCVQLRYFIPNLLPLLLLWTVEGYRRGYNQSPIRWPVIPATVLQVLGVGCISPLFYCLNVLIGRNDINNRPVPAAVAEALMPASFLGFLIPLALMLLPFESSVLQTWAAIWQATPVYFAVLVAGIAYLGPKLRRRAWSLDTGSDRENSGDLFASYRKKDVEALLFSYGVTFALSASLHICTLVYVHNHAELTFARVFFDLPNPFSAWDIGPVEGAFIFFKYDMVLFFSAAYVYVMYTIWETRRLGYITTTEVLYVVAAVVMGQLAVGPAATYVGVWYWRETVLAGLGD